MQFFSADALLLEVHDLGDFDRVVTFLTAEHGKRRGVARGARRRHSRFSGQLQPLSRLRISWQEKQGRDLARLSGAELVRSADPLLRELEGILTAAYLADHMAEFAQEFEASDLLFRLLDSTVTGLLEGVPLNLATRYFEAWMLRLGGIFPPPEACPSCGREPLAAAVLPAGGDALLCRLCAPPGSGDLLVGTEALGFLRRIDHESLRRVALRPPPEEVLATIELVCARVRRRFLQHELRSYRVLEQTLGHEIDKEIDTGHE